MLNRWVLFNKIKIYTCQQDQHHGSSESQEREAAYVFLFHGFPKRLSYKTKHLILSEPVFNWETESVISGEKFDLRNNFI